MWELIAANRRHSAVLVALIAVLLVATGYAAGEAAAEGGGLVGLLAALAVWLVLSAMSYYAGDAIVLSFAGARRIAGREHPALLNVVEEMCIAAGLPVRPDVYIIDDPAPNAFATGRDPEHASVVVTAGLLESLDRDQLQGVIAHELGHVANRDVLYVTMVGILVGSVVLVADVGRRVLFHGGGRRRTSSRDGGQAQLVLFAVAVVLMLLAPILAHLVSLAVSRRREYLADACSALYTRYPEGLASALEVISRSPVRLVSASRATAPMYIVNPLPVSRRGLADLSSTHPPTSERIRILRSMGGGAGLRSYDEAFRRVTGRPVGAVPAGALRAASEVAAARPAAGATAHADRVRQTTDALWRLNGYAFIPCACGTNLKAPPAYSGGEIRCPHCDTPHRVP